MRVGPWLLNKFDSCLCPWWAGPPAVKVKIVCRNCVWEIVVWTVNGGSNPPHGQAIACAPGWRSKMKVACSEFCCHPYIKNIKMRSVTTKQETTWVLNTAGRLSGRQRFLQTQWPYNQSTAYQIDKYGLVIDWLIDPFDWLMESFAPSSLLLLQ